MNVYGGEGGGGGIPSDAPSQKFSQAKTSSSAAVKMKLAVPVIQPRTHLLKLIE